MNDVIIIGSGLSGMISAIVTKTHSPKKNVAVIAFGSGATPMSSGTIDVLSFNGRKYLPSPIAGIQSLPEDHPYKKIGVDNIQKAVNWFKTFSAEKSLPYDGDLNHQIPVITSLGTVKPACLSQTSMDASPVKFADHIVVVGINNVKDFSSNVVAENLQNIFRDKTIDAMNIDLIDSDGRDKLILDVARLLDSDEGIKKFADAVKSKVKPKMLFVTPPIFGTHGSTSHKAAESLLNATIIETTCIPPSPPGLRLHNILKSAVEDLGIDFLEHVKIIDSEIVDDKIISITSTTGKKFKADKFILATGNFFGGGIEMIKFNEPTEKIFNLPVFFTEEWTKSDFFDSQGFAKTGIIVNENLQSNLKNLYIVGKMIGGFDLTAEGSATGVALSSAYKVGIL